MRYLLITLRNLMLSFIFIYLMFGFSLYAAQDHLILPGDNLEFYDCQNLPQNAEPFNYMNERFFYSNKSSDSIVIMYHGNAGSGCAFRDLAVMLEDTNTSYILSVYPGFAGDQRKQNIENMLSYTKIIDNFIEDSGYQKEKSMIIGFSIGAAVASHHVHNENFGEIFLISPFFKLSELTQSLLPFYPTRLMLRNDLQNDYWLNDFKGIINIAYGTNDLTIPNSHTTKLINNLENKGKRINEYKIENVNHNNIMGDYNLLNIIKERIITSN